MHMHIHSPHTSTLPGRRSWRPHSLPLGTDIQRAHANLPRGVAHRYVHVHAGWPAPGVLPTNTSATVVVKKSSSYVCVLRTFNTTAFSIKHYGNAAGTLSEHNASVALNKWNATVLRNATGTFFDHYWNFFLTTTGTFFDHYWNFFFDHYWNFFLTTTVL